MLILPHYYQGGTNMEKSMREVADELGISKDLVKYHRKKLGKEDYLVVKGKYMILETGVAKIKSYLTKEKGAYSTQFEHKVLDKLFEIDMKLLMLSRSLDDLEQKISAMDQGVTTLFDVVVGFED